MAWTMPGPCGGPGDPYRVLGISADASDGLNLAGVRRVLELQQETRRLQAEIDRLNAAARKASPRHVAPAAAQDTPS